MNFSQRQRQRRTGRSSAAARLFAAGQVRNEQSLLEDNPLEANLDISNSHQLFSLPTHGQEYHSPLVISGGHLGMGNQQQVESDNWISTMTNNQNVTSLARNHLLMSIAADCRQNAPIAGAMSNCSAPSPSLEVAAAASSTSASSSSLGAANGIELSPNEMKILDLQLCREMNFSDYEQVWFVKPWQEILARSSCVLPIVLLGLLGNLTIIYSMYKFKPFRTKPTNIFILNMALADLLTTIFCPTAALLTSIYQFYQLGAFLCRFEGFLKITCLLVSAYSLLVLSSEWLLCVVQPCRRRITIRQSWLTLALIWITSLVMATPLLLWRRLRERQWRDVLEVWCCELIEYTKYYWVGITLFLIYLPTFFMTVVLIVILAQMDKFEAKLRRSQAHSRINSNAGGNSSGSNSSSCSGGGGGGGNRRQTKFKNDNNAQLSTINIKYRRRIVKILFTYLLTSIICWTPLQFVIVYRHFRNEAVPAAWFFELAFFSQLAASLSSAMNPIIFGFLSQPFRRVVSRTLMFKLLDKVWTTNKRTTSDNNNHNHNQMHLQQSALQSQRRTAHRRQTIESSAPRNPLAAVTAEGSTSRQAAAAAASSSQRVVAGFESSAPLATTINEADMSRPMSGQQAGVSQTNVRSVVKGRHSWQHSEARSAAAAAASSEHFNDKRVSFKVEVARTAHSFHRNVTCDIAHRGGYHNAAYLGRPPGRRTRADNRERQESDEDEEGEDQEEEEEQHVNTISGLVHEHQVKVATGANGHQIESQRKRNLSNPKTIGTTSFIINATNGAGYGDGGGAR